VTLSGSSAASTATNISLATSAHHRYAGSQLITVTNERGHGIHSGVNRCADKWGNTFLTIGPAPA
jgi:TAP-like protein